MDREVQGIRGGIDRRAPIGWFFDYSVFLKIGARRFRPSKDPFGTLLWNFWTQYIIWSLVYGEMFSLMEVIFMNVIDDASSNPFGEMIREVCGRSGHSAYECSEVDGVYASESKISVRYRKRDSFVKVRKQLKLIVKSLLVINTVVRSN